MTTPKIWFITGAGRGFGRLWALAALERGDKVAATARDTSGRPPIVLASSNDGFRPKLPFATRFTNGLSWSLAAGSAGGDRTAAIALGLPKIAQAGIHQSAVPISAEFVHAA
jgi:NAD(P)-dependent dehydrogenase (short-subunit alcohol dehydrogenase family)